MHYQLTPSHIPARWFASLAFLLLGLSACGGGNNDNGTLTQVNNTPVASNGCDYASGVNLPFNGSLSATDPDGQSLTYSLVNDGSKGSVSINPFTGEFIYTPNMNTRGADTFTFRACEAAPSTVCSNVATYKIVHTPRIMPLGDSITEGIEDSESAACSGTNPFCPAPANRISYRKNLRDALIVAGYTVHYVGTQVNGSSLFSEDRHEGHGGWTANELVNGNSNPFPGTGTANTGFLLNWLNGKTDSAAAPNPTNAGWPDVILLHIGTNDLGPSGDQSNLWTDVRNIRDVISNWSASNSWPVTVVYSRIVNTNPPGSETITFNNNVITNLNPAIWVNHEAVLNASGFYGDSVHPNSSGYSAMADVWLYPLAGMGTISGNYSGSGILQKCP